MENTATGIHPAPTIFTEAQIQTDGVLPTRLGQRRR